MLLVLFLLHLSPSFSPSNVRSRRFLQSGRWHSLLRLCRSDFVFGRLVTCEFVFVMCPCFLLYFLCVVASLQQRPQGCSNYFRDISVAGASPIGLPPSLENKDAGSASVIPSDNDVCLRKCRVCRRQTCKAETSFHLFSLMFRYENKFRKHRKFSTIATATSKQRIGKFCSSFCYFFLRLSFCYLLHRNGERVLDINYQGKYFCTVSRNRVFNKKTHRSSLRLLKTKCMNKIVG